MSHGERTLTHILKYYDMYGIDIRTAITRSLHDFKKMESLTEFLSPFTDTPTVYRKSEMFNKKPSIRKESIDFYDDGDKWLIIVYAGADGVFFMSNY